MNCAEFENYLPDAVEGAYAPEAHQHLHSCRTCAQLAADLSAITRVARELKDADTPGSRVWNSIDAALRQEGLIRESERRPFLVAGGARHWQPAWLLPVAAAFLMAFGVIVYQRGMVPSPQVVATAGVPGSQTGTGTAAEGGDQEALDAVINSTPAARTVYQADLRDANAYIVEAKETVDEDPNDEQAQRALVAAYEQRSMIYQMALQRSLP